MQDIEPEQILCEIEKQSALHESYKIKIDWAFNGEDVDLYLNISEPLANAEICFNRDDCRKVEELYDALGKAIIILRGGRLWKSLEQFYQSMIISEEE